MPETNFILRVPRLSLIFIAAWLIPFAVVVAGLVTYNYVSAMYVPLILMPALFAWAGIRWVCPSSVQRAWPGSYNTKYLRGSFYVLACIAITGHYLLRLSYSQSGIDVVGGEVQELYVAVLDLQSEGSLQSGALGTIGQLLRTAQPFVLICGVMLLYRERGMIHKLFVAAILSGSAFFGYLASFSRGSMMFYLACVLLTAWCMPGSRRKLILYGGALVFTGTIFFVSSARDRILLKGIDEGVQTEALQVLFDCSGTSASDVLEEIGGPETLGLILYLTSPLAEGTHLIMAEASPLMLGGFTFFPFVNPVKRMVGANTELRVDKLDHPNVWFTAVGELYLDFGLMTFIVFPVLAVSMFWLAIFYRAGGLWGDAHYIVTSVFFALFPLYSVFHSFGLVYATSLVLAYFERAARYRAWRRLAAPRTLA